MRPYFAIIKDSFRAALASRVLYVLLIFITLLLLVIAPLHIRETLDWQLPDRGLNSQGIAKALVERQGKPDEAVMTRVWELLPDEDNFKDQLIALVEKEETEEVEPEVDDEEGRRGRRRRDNSEGSGIGRDLIDGLNSVIENPDFYVAADWKNKLLNLEAKELIDSGYDQLSEVEVKRVNRLLLSSAFSRKLIPPGEDSAIEFCYAIWSPIDPLPMSQQQLSKLLISELPWYFEKLVLSIGLLIAIIVTANLIPETFEPGSLNLLLSKPISRWGLYVAKFVGGCAFIAICAAYLFFGLWLWLGILNATNVQIYRGVIEISGRNGTGGDLKTVNEQFGLVLATPHHRRHVLPSVCFEYAGLGSHRAIGLIGRIDRLNPQHTPLQHVQIPTLHRPAPMCFELLATIGKNATGEVITIFIRDIGGCTRGRNG
ncbi:ABC transporter permease [Mariniblastus sp.]|nr:ABC transporter permease [Mariniblastus sp.]